MQIIKQCSREKKALWMNSSELQKKVKRKPDFFGGVFLFFLKKVLVSEIGIEGLPQRSSLCYLNISYTERCMQVHYYIIFNCILPLNC